jgi:hypothetical protein
MSRKYGFNLWHVADLRNVIKAALTLALSGSTSEEYARGARALAEALLQILGVD